VEAAHPGPKKTTIENEKTRSHEENGVFRENLKEPEKRYSEMALY
jgi:hypothetical protein